MTQVGAPRHDPIPIGDVATPPYVRLPDPATLFAQRAQRMRALASGHELKPYLLFLADLCAVQHGIQGGLVTAELPDGDALARAREYGMPPLDRSRFTSDGACDATLERLLGTLATCDMPAPAAAALRRAGAADAADRAEMMRAVLADSIPVEAIAEHAFVTAALQVHFARLATQLDAKSLVPVGDGGPGTIKAETCDSCRSYVKILHQHKDPSLEPIADDIASLGLDLLVRETGLRRGGFNPFLVGY